MTSRLRIAQLANFVGPESGGMKVAISELGKGYVAAGHQRILVIPGEHDSVVEDETGITITVAAPRISATYRMIAKPWRALKALEPFAPTSIEVSDKWTLSPAAGWARRRGIGSVLFSHERLDDMLAGWLRRQTGVETVVGALNRRLAKEFDVVVVTSRYSAGEFAGTGATLRLVPLGVDLETFRPDRGAPSNSGPVQVCYVGRMSHEKDPQLGVAAAAELHRRGVDLELQMYGAGPDEAELAELAGALPITFHGFLADRAQVAQAFARSHLSVSVSPTETFGLAVLEALACGTPVLTADRGGAHELVDASCGECGAPNPRALADAMQRLIARLSPELRAAARARAEEFTWSAATAGMLEIHADLADHPPHLAERRYRREDT